MKQRTHVGRTIDVSIDLAADPQDVFRAWADPEWIVKWFVDSASGEAKAGTSMTWGFESFGVSHPVPVVGVEEGRMLAFGGDLPGQPSFLQEFTFEPVDGGCRLRLLNSGFPDGEAGDESFAAVESGWVLAFATLKRWLETYREGPRTHRLQMRPAVFEYDACYAKYTTQEGLAEWIADQSVTVDGDGTPGTRIQLAGMEGLDFDGTVLERSSREVLLDWPGRSAVLALKCFTMGGEQKAVCLDFNAWEPLATDDRRLERWMTLALNRLVNRLQGLGPALFRETKRHGFL